MPVNGKLSGDSIYELLLDIHVGISLIIVFTTSLVRSSSVAFPRGRPRSDVCHQPQQLSLALGGQSKTTKFASDAASSDVCEIEKTETIIHKEYKIWTSRTSFNGLVYRRHMNIPWLPITNRNTCRSSTNMIDPQIQRAADYRCILAFVSKGHRMRRIWNATHSKDWTWRVAINDTSRTELSQAQFYCKLNSLDVDKHMHA